MGTARSYHREDLRGELIRGGHAFVAANGHERLTMRALTVLTQVSSAAPYHHFPDRRALLLALAEDGFTQLFAAGRAVLQRPLAPAARLQALAEAFLSFQRDHPRLLELMYESELSRPELDPVLAAWQLRGFNLVSGVIADALPAGGQAGDADVRGRAITFWATLYGFASLSGKGLLQPFAGEEAMLTNWREATVTRAVAVAVGPAAPVRTEPRP